MGQNVGMGTLAAIAVVAVLILGIVAWRTFGGRRAPSPGEVQQQMQSDRQDHMRRMPPGGVQTPGY
jgi:Sec-independent protein translocase protein TatA